MRVVIFGATGFVGWAVLHEALAAPDVAQVLAVGRRSVDLKHPKLRNVLVPDLENPEGITDAIVDVDACFWCLGTSSAGMDEETYTRITYTYAVGAAKVLSDANPGLRFCFVSGEGADGKAMWARVKKRTEDALLSMPGLRAVVLRPAYIRASHGAELRGWLYKTGYAALVPTVPLLRALGWATSGAEIGRAMMTLARGSAEPGVLRSKDINRLAEPFGTNRP